MFHNRKDGIRKTAGLLLAAALTLSCTACQKEAPPTPDTTAATTAVTTTTATTTATQPLPSYLTEKYATFANGGWLQPTKADLQGTSWVWENHENDHHVVYRVTFNEWTVDVTWNDGIDASDHEYPDAAYELHYENGLAEMEIDFREMNGKMYFTLLLAPERDSLYVVENNGDSDREMRREKTDL